MPIKKMHEFSVMRAFAILIILFHHLPDYSFNYYNLAFIGLNYDLSFLNDLNRYFGLSIFVYISGYLQSYSHYDFSRWQDVRRFFIKKVIRIYPLYIFALIIFVSIIAPTDFKGFIVHLLGLQIVLSPAFCDPIITLWYVGLIMFFYVIFVILKKYGDTPQRTLVLVVAIPLIAIALRLVFQIIEKRFFVYYLIFIAGIYSPKLFNADHLRPRITFIASSVLLTTTYYLYLSHVYPYIINEATRPTLFSIVGLEALVSVSIIMICFAWISHNICLKINYLPKLFELISYSSYCMYLLHRPLWWAMLQVFNPANNMLRGLYLSGLGIPILIFLSFLIQNSYDKFSRYLAPKSVNAL